MFAGFSSRDNSNITLITPFKYNIIQFPTHEVNVMWIHNTDLGRRSPWGSRVLCREYVPSRHIRSSGRALSPLLVNSTWTGGPVVQFRLLPTEVVGSISSGGDYGMHCWRDPIRSKQLFSVSHVGLSSYDTLIYIYIYTLKWIGPHENLFLSYLFFFNTCFWRFTSSSSKMVYSGVPFGLYSGDCFDKVVVLFNSRICVCECSG